MAGIIIITYTRARDEQCNRHATNEAECRLQHSWDPFLQPEVIYEIFLSCQSYMLQQKYCHVLAQH